MHAKTKGNSTCGVGSLGCTALRIARSDKQSSVDAVREQRQNTPLCSKHTARCVLPLARRLP